MYNTILLNLFFEKLYNTMLQNKKRYKQTKCKAKHSLIISENSANQIDQNYISDRLNTKF